MFQIHVICSIDINVLLHAQNSVLNFPVTGFLVVWGWYVVFAVIALFLIKQKLEPQIEAARKKRREQEYANFGELKHASFIVLTDDYLQKLESRFKQ